MDRIALGSIHSSIYVMDRIALGSIYIIMLWTG